MRLSLLLPILLVFGNLSVQGQEPAYSRRNTFSVFTAYSNTSSHLVLGIARNRRLTELGLTYSRRLLHTHYADWNYDLDFHPMRVIEDPTILGRLQSINGKPVTSPPAFQQPILQACTSGVFTTVFILPNAPSITLIDSIQCGTRWTYAGGVSPLGQRVNFLPRKRLQPFIFGNGGFAASNRDIPVTASSRFNFTFECGAGVQWFKNHHDAWALEYHLHHLSNDFLGDLNPGIDNQIVRVSYSFGR